MKKASTWIIVSVVLLAVYFGGTWMTSRMAQAQMTRFTDYLTRESHGVFKVSDIKSTNGFFSSEQDITFSVDYPIATALLGNKEPVKFTVHNVIQHGPVPGFRTIGIARAQSTIVMDESTRKMIKDVLGTDEPIEVALTFGFLGSTVVHVDSPAMNVQLPGESGTLTWKGMKSRTVFSRKFDQFSTSASVPGMTIKIKDGSGVDMNGMEIKGKFKSAFKSLYVGDGLVSFESLDFNPKFASQDVVHVKKAHYGFTMSEKGPYYSMSLEVGADSFIAGSPLLQDLHFDFSMNHLHGLTVASLNDYVRDLGTSLKPMAASPPTTQAIEAPQTDLDMRAQPNLEPPAPTPAIDFEKIQADVAMLMKHDPEIVLDHFGFRTDKGAMKLSARVKLIGVTEQDIQQMDLVRLMEKLNVTADFSIAQSLVDNWPVPSQQSMKQQILQLEAQGFMKKNGDQLESHIEYTKGKLVANGKGL
jgi:uncharacterized protein YdgA (DUF945 family)